MSGYFNYDESGSMVCKIGDKRIMSISPKPVDDGFNEFTCKGESCIQHIPNKNTERNVLYITGQSGSGKSYYTAQYIKEYHKMFPKREVFIFSSLADDSTLDKLKYIKRIKIKEAPFLNSSIGVADFKDTLTIFDDVDVISDKVVKNKVFKLLNEILETGRHFNTSCIFTSHNATMGLDTKRILNECHSITIFPKNLGGKTARYLLDQYLGMDKEQVAKIRKINSRWVTIMKTYPQCIISEKSAWVVNPS